MKDAFQAEAFVSAELTDPFWINCLADPLEDRLQGPGHGLTKSPGDAPQSTAVPLAQFRGVGHNALLSIIYFFPSGDISLKKKAPIGASVSTYKDLSDSLERI